MLLYRHRRGAVRATFHSIEHFKRIWDFSLNDGCKTATLLICIVKISDFLKRFASPLGLW